MKDLTNFLALPASLITLTLLSPLPSAHCEPWPYNLPPHERYFPEHEPHIKRDLLIQQQLALAPPVGMRKMSGDEGEKFFLDYWQFEVMRLQADERVDPLGPVSAHRTDIPHNSSSSICGLLPPILPHSEKQSGHYFPRIFGRSLFERDFQCPVGTSDCTSIGQPDACCKTGETCISVQDTGSGPVGCCPSGETCGGEVASCNTAEGYTSCPGSANGGCCIPGYSCQGVGCVYVGSTTTTTTLPLATVTTGVTTNEPSSTTTEISVSAATSPGSVQTVTTTIVTTPEASTGVTTVTQIITISPSTTTTPSTITTTTTPLPSITSTTSTSGQGALTCTQGYHSCPASLGGGCCPTDRSCADNNLCLATSTSTTTVSTQPTSTASAVPPVRPTSGSESSQTTTSAASTVVSGCPTGFYMCSAYYLGGCCRVGRNCDTRSCPSSASTAVVAGSSLTIVTGGSGASSVSVVTYTSTTTPGATVTAGSGSSGGGTCASGWFGCASSDGGGCCPSGYLCGASCTATISGQNNVGKESPSAGVRVRAIGWMLVFVGFVSGVGMVVL